MRRSPALVAVLSVVVFGVFAFAPPERRPAPSRRSVEVTSVMFLGRPIGCLTVPVATPPITLDPALLVTGDVVTAVQHEVGVAEDSVFGPATAAAIPAQTNGTLCATDLEPQSPLLTALNGLAGAQDQLIAEALARRVVPRFSGGSAAIGFGSCGSDFACFKACTLAHESDNAGGYQAISPGGTYRGAWQFDQRTWESNGGTGDPAAASPEEQDRVANNTWQARGNQPWGGRC